VKIWGRQWARRGVVVGVVTCAVVVVGAAVVVVGAAVVVAATVVVVVDVTVVVTGTVDVVATTLVAVVATEVLVVVSATGAAHPTATTTSATALLTGPIVPGPDAFCEDLQGSDGLSR
jgi:hypothetical protein